MNEFVSALSADEAEQVNKQLQEMYGFADSNEQVVQTRSLGKDRMGRDIISFNEYNRLREQGYSLSGMMMRVVYPPVGSIHLVEASKLTKWTNGRDGYVVLEEWQRRKSTEKRLETRAEEKGNLNWKDQTGNILFDGEKYPIFFCKDKYPECDRYFDSPAARVSHWGLHHERKLDTRPRKPRAKKTEVKDGE